MSGQIIECAGHCAERMITGQKEGGAVLTEEQESIMTAVIVCAFFPGVGTAADVLSAHEGSETITPQSVARAVDEASIKVGIKRTQ